MTRLSKNEISKHREWLTAWQQPPDMKNYVEEVNRHMGAKDFFNQAGIEFLRDAWTAAEFAVLRKAPTVRLVSSGWPDFEVQLGIKIEQFESVEADQPGRRRGEEYREAETLGYDSAEEWRKRGEQVPAILRTALKKKIGKQYGSKTQLVINLNINEFGILQREIELCFPRICELGRGKFDAVWILWKGKIYGPFAGPLGIAV